LLDHSLRPLGGDLHGLIVRQPVLDLVADIGVGEGEGEGPDVVCRTLADAACAVRRFPRVFLDQDIRECEYSNRRIRERFDAGSSPMIALPKVLSSTQYQAGRTAVFISWVEDDYSSTQPIATLVLAPTVPAETTVATTFNHDSLLRTTEEMLGLATMGDATTAASMRGSFHLGQ
jgi:hypothetical protein